MTKFFRVSRKGWVLVFALLIVLPTIAGAQRSDILWHNASTGETQIWQLMDGHKVAGRATVLGENGSATLIGPPWSIVGINDMNGDGKSDILWHNSSTNETQIWFMAGDRVSGRATVLGENGSATFVGPPWSIVGAGDSNGDGKADILWHNSSTNETQIWFMAGDRVSGRATVLGENGSATLIGPPWSIVGINDMNGDGKSDILWHNSSTNETKIWFMAGDRVSGRATVLGENGSATSVGPPWSIVGAGDSNGDGKADILWHNSSTNETQIWFMAGGRVSGRATVLGENGSATFVGPPWSIVGINTKQTTGISGTIRWSRQIFDATNLSSAQAAQMFQIAANHVERIKPPGGFPFDRYTPVAYGVTTGFTSDQNDFLVPYEIPAAPYNQPLVVTVTVGPLFRATGKSAGQVGGPNPVVLIIAQPGVTRVDFRVSVTILH